MASPNSTAQGVVNNNATMIAPSSMPSFKMSQGIVCASPSLTITPYVTDSWSFALPRETVTRTPIYDEDTGEIKYYSEMQGKPGTSSEEVRENLQQMLENILPKLLEPEKNQLGVP